ncbi:hypothetical protein [Edaphobacter sp.]|uniref:hypothetical protein n=1 Tax=Edaphobacter sp. TaxID=1934404 RepID=UPI002DBB2F32|nr:hypothetical protein [Edaphobacter sp.]HEU5341985.1 hypothetical protein [Edaphobacter sp.]
MTREQAEQRIIAAAQAVSHSYAAGGGYTFPLAVTLRELNKAVTDWYQLVHAPEPQ